MFILLRFFNKNIMCILLNIYCFVFLPLFNMANIFINLLSYLPFDSSFISTQFLVLNLDGWFVVSSTQRTFHVESTSNWRGYYVDTLNTKFRRISTSFPCHFHFFDVISLIEKFTSFPRTFFDVNLIAEESTLFTSTFFDEILMN